MTYPKEIYADTDLVCGEEAKEGHQKYIRADDRLLHAIKGVMEIVEGVRHERWSANGTRLTDTPEWCELYVAWCADKRKHGGMRKLRFQCQCGRTEIVETESPNKLIVRKDFPAIGYYGPNREKRTA